MKRKALDFFIILFFITEMASAQNQDKILDSLNHILQTAKDDTSKINALNALSLNLWQTGEFIKAAINAKEALSLSKKTDFKKGLSKAYNNLGAINLMEDNYTEALKNELASLKIAEEINNKRLMVGPYNNMGNIYFRQGNDSEALKNYFASLKIGQETGSKQSISNNYNNIAIIYQHQNNYPEALKNYFASSKIKEEIGDKKGIAKILDNIATVYFYQANYSESLKNHLEALKIRQEIGDKEGIVYCYLNLGELSVKLRKLTEANEYLQKALVLSKEIKSKELTKQNYYALSNLDSIEGNFKGAYQFFTMYSDLKDSLLNEKSNKDMSQLRVQYETDKKEKEISTQNLKITTQNLQLRNQTLQNRILQISIIVSLMIIGIIVLLFYLSGLRNKKKKKEYEYMLTDLELTVLKAQLNPHFISNSLNAIKNIIDQQPSKASQSILKFARLMRRVLEQNEQPLISLKEELETAELYMQVELLRLRYGFDYQFNCDSSIDQDLLLVPPLILQPTIENAIWHGLSTKGEKGHIIIGIKMENNLLKFTIEDNGTGQRLPQQEESIQLPKKKSYGISITRKRIDVMNRGLENNGYYNLNFLEGRTITEIALPVFFS